MGRLRGLVARPPHATIDSVDAELPEAWTKFEKACGDFISTQTARSVRAVTWAHVSAMHRRLDQLLDLRNDVRRAQLLRVLEEAREAQGREIEDWWLRSWPGTPPPPWPAEFQDEEDAA